MRRKKMMKLETRDIIECSQSSPRLQGMGGWFLMAVLGHVLKLVPRHVLGRHVPKHVLEHMPGHVLRLVRKHVPDRHVPEYVLKHVPKHVLRHMLDKHVLEHVLNRMAHAVLMT